MSRTPGFLIAINRIIGRTLRRIQLTHGEARKHLQASMRLLNEAKKAHLMALHTVCDTYLRRAINCVKLARFAVSLAHI